jgi:hypothetical protein
LPQTDVSLKVNDKPIRLDRFAGSFISGTVLGMLSSLRGMENIEDIESVKVAVCGRSVAVVTNGAEIEINRFLQGFIYNTVTAMVSELNGVDAGINSLELTLLLPLTNQPSGT